MKNSIVQLVRDNARRERRPLNLVRAEASTDSTLYLYDIIDAYWGINADDFAAQLASADASGTLHLRMNSPGGDVFEARTIASLLREWKGRKVAHVDGLAASAMTTIAMACDEMVMATGSFFMIHNAWTFAYGNKADLAEVAALLDQIDGEIARDYMRRSGASADKVAAWMNAETWFNAEEALANGFATSIAGADEPAGDDDEPDEDDGSAENRAARWNLSAFANAPKALIDRPKPRPREQRDWGAVHANNSRRLRLLNLA